MIIFASLVRLKKKTEVQKMKWYGRSSFHLFVVGLLEDAAGGALDGVKVDLKNKIAVESKTEAGVEGENKNLKTGLWKMKLGLVWK